MKRVFINPGWGRTATTTLHEELYGKHSEILHIGRPWNNLTSAFVTELKRNCINYDQQLVASMIKKMEDELVECTDPVLTVKLEKRLARLSAKVAIVKVGANSEVELQEKQARVEDAICATKAAIKQGIVSGGGIALLNAANDIEASDKSEEALLEAIKAPFKTILHNAGIEQYEMPSVTGYGINVVTGNMVNMIDAGIIDPLLVTKSALQNAASVATTILSTDCVINNLRIDEGNR